MKHLLMVFMVCSFIEAREQSMLKICFFRCENNDIYANTVLLEEDCEDVYDVTAEDVE